MSSEIARDVSARKKPAWLRGLHGAENWLMALVLVALIVLPLAEIVARRVFSTYVPDSAWWIQHLTLAIGTLGALLAAREGRMLALSTAQSLLRGRLLAGALIFGNATGAAIASWLGVAGLWWLHSSVHGDVEAGAQPLAIVTQMLGALWHKPIQALLPLGFLAIAIRLVLATRGGFERLVTLLLAIAFSALALQEPISRENLSWAFLIGLLVATALGTPVFATLGGAALILFWRGDVAIATVAIDHYQLATNAVLPSIPLFTLAGYFLAEGGSAPRVVRLCQALVGSLRGGTAIVTALACAFFTTFTGASGVTILAVGGLMMPVLLKLGYGERKALGLLTGAGSLGMLFPPCLPLILYAIRAEIELKQIFLAGIVPGVLLVVVTSAYGAWIAPKGNEQRQAFSGSELRSALWGAKWELVIPVIALGGLFSGLATSVETSALTALYALFVVTVVHRDLHPVRKLPAVLADGGLMVGGIILILGVAMGFTQWLVDAEAPEAAVDWVKTHIESRLMFLLALNFLMLLVGCLMDVFSAIIIVVPLLLPMGKQFGIDPLHLGIVILANLELGYLTPPIGLNLFLASYRFKKPLPEVYKAAVPMILVLGFGVLVITYVPELSLWLPRWLGK